MAKDKKFESLLEKYQSRFEQKGFLVGDVFKFDDNYKSHEAFDALPKNVKDVLDSYVDSGLHIRVTAVGDGGDHIVVAQDHGGGRYIGKVEIPCCLGEPLDFGDNLPPLPDALKRDDLVTIKPEEVPELPTDDKGAVETSGDYTTTPHLKDEDEEEVVKESYTSNYM